MGSSAGFSVATALSAWAMKIWLKRINSKIRQTEDESVLRFAY